MVHSHLSELNPRLLRYAAIIFCVLLNSSVIAFFLATRLQRVITRPVRRLLQHRPRRLPHRRLFPAGRRLKPKTRLGNWSPASTRC